MAVFREEKNSGRLMHIETDPNSQYVAYIWFDYNLNLMRSLQEGDFLAVESFSSLQSRKHYVILQIVKKLPRHYALPTDLKGYPGFLMEAAKSASQDWTTQIEESTEDTTKIVCEAVPINLGFYLENEESKTKESLKEDFSLPMPGKDVKILSYEFMQDILNLGLKEEDEGVTQIGHLQHNSDINILLDIESLLRLHFGIFGFTGAGKSNLISTLVSKIMEKSPPGTKIVMFDIMGEYLTLLIDLLIRYPKSKVIGVGAETFIQDLYSYYDKETENSLEEAAQKLVKTNLYPKKLSKKEVKKKFLYPIKELIKRRAFRIYESGRYKLIEEVFEEAGMNTINIAGADKKIIREILDAYRGRLAYDVVEEVLRKIDSKLTSGKTNTEKFKNELTRLLKPPKVRIDNEEVFTSIDPNLVNELNDEKTKAIYIIQSHNPDDLKRFVKYLASALYEDRRKNGTIFPLVSFILDEADEYIPQDTYAKGESKTSREAVEMLARRGRKFGIGIGIATQRVVYLDTNIMAQPHTYFISKLPRSSDRERVAEAFAMSESMFEQTFRFGKGDWLLVSHDATGLESIPFPIHTANAEERIIRFLENYDKEFKQR